MESEIKNLQRAIADFKQAVWEERFSLLRFVLIIWLAFLIIALAGCKTTPNSQLPPADLPMHDEGDRVCVLVEEDFIYCVKKNQPRTIDI